MTDKQNDMERRAPQVPPEPLTTDPTACDLGRRCGLLTDTDIREALESEEALLRIHNFSEECLTPVGYDLRAGETLYSARQRRVISLDHGSFTVRPKDTVFISTYETLELSRYIAGITTSRLGPQLDGLFATALTIDPTWHGNLLVILTNFSNAPVAIRHRQPLLTASFFHVATESSSSVARERWNNENVRELFRKYEGEAKRLRHKQLLIDSIVVVGLVASGLGMRSLGWLTTSVEVVTASLAAVAIYFSSVRDKVVP